MLQYDTHAGVLVFLFPPIVVGLVGRSLVGRLLVGRSLVRRLIRRSMCWPIGGSIRWLMGGEPLAWDIVVVVFVIAVIVIVVVVICRRKGSAFVAHELSKKPLVLLISS